MGSAEPGGVVLTREALRRGARGGVWGDWGDRQLRALGIETPRKKGWLDNVIGKSVTRAAYDEFLRLAPTGKKPR